MISEIFQNTELLIGIGLVLLLIGYKLMFSKNKDLKILERQYSELVNSEEYRVKGQRD